MSCYSCGYFRIHHLEVTEREFCALTGEEYEDIHGDCPFFALPGSNPYMPEHRETFEENAEVDPVFNNNTFIE